MKRPFIIGIGASQSKVGKTTIASSILEYFKRNNLSKSNYFLNFKRLGAIKYTKTEIYISIIDDKYVLRKKDKDTRRLLDAGAENVLWVQSPKNELIEIMPLAISRLSHLDCVVIEGNSAIEFSYPDIVVFINVGNMKPSARSVMKIADIIIDSKDIPQEELMKLIEAAVRRNKIKKILKEKTIDGKITCSSAKKIAEELKISYKEIGTLANDLKIKITECELGCF